MLTLSLGGAFSVDAAEPFNVGLTVASQTHDTYEVHAEITNNGNDFTGTLRIIVMGPSYNAVGYDLDISIPAGSTKDYKLMLPRDYVNPNENTRVIIYDKSMHKKYTELFKNVFTGFSDTIKVGLLSDNADKLKFLDMSGNKVEVGGEKYFIKLKETSSDTILDDIEGLSMLVIDDYDTSVLGEDKMKKLESWVNDGGMLVIGTGESAEKVLNGFRVTSDISISSGNISMSSITFEDGTYFASNPYMKADIYCGDGFYSGVYDDYIKASGFGSVVVCPIRIGNLSDNSFDASSVANGLLRDAIQARSDNGYSNGSVIDYYDIKNVECYMEKPAKMGRGALVAIFLIYIVLVGPVIYLILKAMNKREKIWVVIPALSLLFMGFVFLLSLSVKVKGLTLKSVSLVDLENNTEKAYIFGYQPDPKEWTVKTKDDKYLSGTSLCYSYNRTEESVSGAFKKSGNLYMTAYPASTFDMETFLVNKIPEGKYGKFDVNAGIKEGSNLNGLSDDQAWTSALNGKITNNTGVDFDYVLFNVSGTYQIVEGLKNGESFDIDLSSGQYSNYMGDLVDKICGPDYKTKNYDKAADLAALSLAYGSYSQNSNGAGVFGIVRSDSITDSKEDAWTCYYMNINSLLY